MEYESATQTQTEHHSQQDESSPDNDPLPKPDLEVGSSTHHPVATSPDLFTPESQQVNQLM